MRLAYNVAVPTLIDLSIAMVANVENVHGDRDAVLFNVTGNAADNILTGNASNNTLIGGDGNDTLNGGAGADNQQGGVGNDLFLLGAVAEFAAGERIDGGANTDTLRYTGTTRRDADAHCAGHQFGERADRHCGGGCKRHGGDQRERRGGGQRPEHFRQCGKQRAHRHSVC